MVITKWELTYIQLAPVEQPLLALRPALQAGLEEQAERTLRVDERAGVLEGEAGLAVDHAAHDPVEVVGAAEERKLTQRVQPALGKPAAALAPDARDLSCEGVDSTHRAS